MLCLQPWQAELMMQVQQPDFRWLTGHWVHANLYHLLENLLALWLILALFAGYATTGLWLILMFGAIGMIDLGLYVGSNLQAYYGFSGCLHAWLVFGSFSYLIQAPARFYGLNGLLLVKLLAEILWGSPSAALIGPVAIQAHWLGALAGGWLGWSYWRYGRTGIQA